MQALITCIWSIVLCISLYYNCCAQNIHPIFENGRLVVSDNGRYLQFENGKPFFWLGDTGWLLFKKLNREEAEIYLEDRVSKGFNVIQVMVIHEMPAINVYGDSAFVNNNPAEPKITEGSNTNDSIQYDFWDHIDYIIDKAAEKGIFMALVPVWGSNVKSNVVNISNAASYASWLAKRYKDKPNIIWVNGGDAKGGDNLDVWNTIGKTIRQNDPNHLITFHPFGRTQSSTWFHNEEWLDFNMFQSGHKRYDQDPEGFGEDNWKYVQSDYDKLPVKPTLDGEPSYEGIPQGLHDSTQPYWTSSDVRRYAYWSVFAGACGFTYGNNAVMQMHKPYDKDGAYGVKKFWYEALNDTGAAQMKHLKNLMLKYPYFERLPDQTIVVGDKEKKYNRIIATRGKNYFLVYTYTGRTFKVDLDKIDGTKINTYWFNTRNGESEFLKKYNKKGIVEFNPPGEPDNGNDWLLIIEY